jgi:hypothetical protein
MIIASKAKYSIIFKGWPVSLYTEAFLIFILVYPAVLTLPQQLPVYTLLVTQHDQNFLWFPPDTEILHALVLGYRYGQIIFLVFCLIWMSSWTYIKLLLYFLISRVTRGAWEDLVNYSLFPFTSSARALWWFYSRFYNNDCWWLVREISGATHPNMKGMLWWYLISICLQYLML